MTGKQGGMLQCMASQSPAWEGCWGAGGGQALLQQARHDALNEPPGLSLVGGLREDVGIRCQHKGQNPNQLGPAPTAHISLHMI